MIRAIFFDIDGTLVSLKSKVYSQSTKVAVEKLRDRGILVFVATGRSKFEIADEHLLDGLEFDAYMTNNGQEVHDWEGNCIYSRPLHPQDALTAWKLAKEKGFPTWVVGDEDTIMDRHDERVLAAMECIHTTPPQLGDVDAVIRKPIYKVVLFAKREEVLQFMPYLPHSRTTQWYPYGHDIISLEGGKANAMQAVMDHYGIGREETMAFGDSQNDIDMLRLAHIGVSMGNGTKEAKEAADYVTDDEDEDGIYNAIKHFELI